MSTLTRSQSTALDALHAFAAGPAATSFLVEGGAGTGKTYIATEYLRGVNRARSIIAAAPTHKAVHVLRRKLDAASIRWSVYAPRRRGAQDGIVTGTTAQLLGIGPVIAEDQDPDERHFAKVVDGAYEKLRPGLILIDEVSMLAWPGLHELHSLARASGAKIVAVGDSAQLPPVNEQAIPFSAFRHCVTLREIIRQAGDSAIIQLAWAIRDEQPWQGIAGTGIRRVADLLAAFVAEVEAPGTRPEEERSVFIAYRNARVNAVQDAACRKVYGHDRRTFASGELVLSESNLRRGDDLLCTNQEELIVDAFREDRRDAVLGVPVDLHRRADPTKRFSVSYLSPEELDDPHHPYNIELHERLERARARQAEWTSAPTHTRQLYEARRVAAWQAYFEWREQIVTFRHPFAITSHKSQGSTYKRVFADTQDLARFSKRALYVAVTRPSEELIVPEG